MLELIKESKCPGGSKFMENISIHFGLTLHTAISTRYSLEVIKSFVACNEAALMDEDVNGLLPLHHTISARRDIEVLDFILSANEASVS